MIPVYLGGRAFWDHREQDLDVALYELLDGEIVIFGPMPGLGQPHLFVRPLGGERGIVRWLLSQPT